MMTVTENNIKKTGITKIEKTSYIYVYIHIRFSLITQEFFF